MQSVKFRLKFFSIFTFLLFISGCATIPSEAPQLSGELGKRISAIEKSNLTLLHKFFDLKRNEVDKFIEKEWTDFRSTIKDQKQMERINIWLQDELKSAIKGWSNIEISTPTPLKGKEDELRIRVYELRSG